MFCRIGDTDLYYEVRGDGMPLLLIHGYGVDHRLMTGCMEPLFKDRAGWKRIYVDLPGMGKTEANNSIKCSDDVLDLILKFVDQVLPGQSFTVGGESYGGYLSMGIVYKVPEKVDGVLLICPATIIDRKKRDLPGSFTLVKDPDLMSSLTPSEAEELRSMTVVPDRYVWERYKEDIMPGMLMANEQFLKKFKDEGYPFSFDARKLPQQYTKPMLLLTGRQDNSVGYKDAWPLLDDYPRGTFAVLDRAGHNLQIEQDRIFSCMVNEWLDRVEEHTDMR